MRSDLIVSFLEQLAGKAFGYSKELEPIPERGFVILKARELVESIRYYVKARDKRQAEERVL